VTRLRRLARALLPACLVLAGCATARLDDVPPVRAYPATGAAAPAADRHDDTFRLMTLNVAHGRGESFHQLLQTPATTRANLDGIATLLGSSGADVIALQEVDGPSFWSGNFSHVDYLAHKSAFAYAVHGAHVNGLGLSYGTALLARHDLRNPRTITFDPALSPVPKGFVVSTVSWPGQPGIEVDVASVHLDFASAATRRQQARELIDTLKARQRPLVVMGDFNNGWQENSVVREICRELALTAYAPEATGLATFPALGQRLDWILVSAGITFRSYRVLADSVSDHRGVIAELALARDRTLRMARAN
jgi:endonuclease/exonuclease/phosphatase family metal-dependent hydrolase